MVIFVVLSSEALRPPVVSGSNRETSNFKKKTGVSFGLKGGKREEEAVYSLRAEKGKCSQPSGMVHWSNSSNRMVPQVLPTWLCPQATLMGISRVSKNRSFLTLPTSLF